MRIPFPLLAFVFTCAMPGWSADPLDSVLNKLDQASAGFKGMSADLKQTAHNAVINEDQIESGTIRMKRNKPGDTRMLVDFAHPDPKVVQLQGQTADIYLPNSQTVQEYNLGKNSSLVEQFLLLGFGTTRADLEKTNDIKYIGEDAINGQKAAHLELTPKSKEVLQHVKKIELWLSPDTGRPLQHKIFEPGGDYHLVNFDNLKMNPPDLTDASMKLKLPKNVKIEKVQ